MTGSPGKETTARTAAKKSAPKETTTVSKTEPAAPSPYDPWRSMADLREEVDHLFERFVNGLPTLKFGRGVLEWPTSHHLFQAGAISPRIDIGETDGQYEVTAELPGMDQKDVELEIRDNVLTMKGEKSEERDEKKKDYRVTERRFGRFERTFPLPEEVDESKISAEFKKGVLTVTLPKSAKAQKSARKIDVKAA